ncbi:MAG: hypothetical protein A3J07_02185 [Candidatus Doudnabacteria bacterium RIFCSPLOWO2_02_FULL_49_13]|uniref:Uncharacterized protein n=1 Tax=Candidatus Doudnabacteria bacterium RIFCSPHIGHO2_12_FULL_48_16 TaxID=1817838 RepID=A0A1F5PM49_9BACT|nr:MAG: hypothetical protein A3B77_00525 [Candidatus Doudnabacteria bacterium RIFCSPHIGHO2_02_FULL_49_24]OGE90742.1 MAG: hypothetical protein A3E29_01285 [Candidatus Doudnabacteria bacterium RIFCSPHIGHO2_12_FULL_48_16]OGE97336.1 MAG: hypothetical protein A2990_04415 [Candidatus Doudnabacteria bacterium RIFCSPLOWO2_01_FULL_49_40]OGF02605.1 MAG: hypothetical protein A3J07_02185 [Candidatus Doudnabacteria bacterium RIFCSPLOWO2_02_FULL_49_13]OGF03645.1 MAG: hypothetical protein A3H14_03765 [Candida
MKKILFLTAGLMLLAAACNAGNQASTGNSTESNSASRVDAAVSNLNASVDSEEAVNLQSDDDVINSDQTIVNDYEGATNANY